MPNGREVGEMVNVLRMSQRFDRWVHWALYGPDGFYATGGRPGRFDGDFVTAPERGQLFGRCVARFLEDEFARLGRPDPFVVVEAGAGAGTLAATVLASLGGGPGAGGDDASADCAAALRYVAVDTAAPQRALAEARLAADGRAQVAAALPEPGTAHVVLANELLDNLPPRLLVVPYRRGPDNAAAADIDWLELHIRPVRLDIAPLLIPAPALRQAAAMASALVPNADEGTVVPLQIRAATWVRKALRTLKPGGRLLLFDYGKPTTVELVSDPISQWFRAYAAHVTTTPRKRRNVYYSPLLTENPKPPSPLAVFEKLLPHAGTADLTCDVAFDQLATATNDIAPMRLTTQADWLNAHGLNDLIQQARHTWQSTLAAPNTTTLAARALLDEAADITNPSTFGAFHAATWQLP